jgi:predicted MPP superfamily phosphohydrolase
MAFFLLTFFAVYGGMNLYAFLRLRTAVAPDFRTAVPLALFTLLMVAAPILVRMSEGAGLDRLARLLAWIGYIWMGLLLIFVTAAVALDGWRLLVLLAQALTGRDLHHLLPHQGRAVLVLLGISVLLSLYGGYEAQAVRAEYVTIETDKIPREAKPVTVVQISDVHVGLIVGKRRLGRILDVVRDAGPDMLVSTGDLVDGQINDLDGLSGLFAEIEPRLGKFAVTGNHEFYAGLDQALSFTRRAGFTVLRDAGEPGVGGLNLAGVDDRGRRAEKEAAAIEADLLSSLPRGKFTILLKHRPLVEEDSCGLFDLQLSGHSHSGQMFPFGLVTGRVFPLQGRTTRLPGGCTIHVSRGSGTWGPPMRLLSPPEVTVVRIVGRG